MFSIIIPSWNNLALLKLCIHSLKKNSVYSHQIIIHVNDGSDGSLEWVQASGLEYTYTPENIGICYAVNQAAALSTRPYILYLNDDMYCCPDWDAQLVAFVKTLNTNAFMLSSTMIEPRETGNACVVVRDFGRDIATFDEARLLKELPQLSRPDWNGATWPPTLVHRDWWFKVGGYSIEFSPGMGSDNDFSMKMWQAGCRIFRGIGNSLAYHFQTQSTSRIKKNNGRQQFICKWGMPPSLFDRYHLRRGSQANSIEAAPVNSSSFSYQLKKLSARINALFYYATHHGFAHFGETRLKNKRIIISKANQIGDVTFILPLASALKRLDPSCTIIFLSRKYTQSLVEHYIDVDEFIDWDILGADGVDLAAERLKALRADIIIHATPKKEIFYAAKKARIPIRIASMSKIYSWLTCNRLTHISRSKSDLHETQLDMKLLKPLVGKKQYSLDEIIALRRYRPFANDAACLNLLDKNKFNLILHPKTNGEHIEWSPENFAELIKLLPPERFNIFVSGSAKEGDQVRATMITPFPHVIDLCGAAPLNDFMQLIAQADGLICASTGPVHLAANFAIRTLGLYAPIRPFHADRWGPVGEKAQILQKEKNCEACRYQGKCKCINEINVQEVLNIVFDWEKESLL